VCCTSDKSCLSVSIAGAAHANVSRRARETIRGNCDNELNFFRGCSSGCSIYQIFLMCSTSIIEKVRTVVCSHIFERISAATDRSLHPLCCYSLTSSAIRGRQAVCRSTQGLRLGFALDEKINQKLITSDRMGIKSQIKSLDWILYRSIKLPTIL
jgi:hypothetical protein